MKLDERPVIPLQPEQMQRKVTDLIRLLNQTVNAMQAGGPGATYTATTAPPSLGSYAAGTVVLNSSPTELGSAPNTYVVYGWICTASGTPGTWEAMNVPSDVFGGGGGSGISGEATVTVTAGLEHTETVAAVGVLPAMKVFLAIAPHDDDDENNPLMLDILAISGTAGTDTIDVNIAFGARTSGPIKLNYLAS